MYLGQITGKTGGKSSRGQFGETKEAKAKSFNFYTYKMCIINNYRLKN